MAQEREIEKEMKERPYKTDCREAAVVGAEAMIEQGMPVRAFLTMLDGGRHVVTVGPETVKSTNFGLVKQRVVPVSVARENKWWPSKLTDTNLELVPVDEIPDKIGMIQAEITLDPQNPGASIQQALAQEGDPVDLRGRKTKVKDSDGVLGGDRVVRFF